MADATLRSGPIGPLLKAGERRTRLQNMVADSPAYFLEADRLGELSLLIEERVSDPEAREAYDCAISKLPFAPTRSIYFPSFEMLR